MRISVFFHLPFCELVQPAGGPPAAARTVLRPYPPLVSRLIAAIAEERRRETSAAQAEAHWAPETLLVRQDHGVQAVHRDSDADIEGRSSPYPILADADS
jgi:hypothetical protein